jgi:5-methyltetrahydrofolate--homocysteine methyltransferase
VKIAPEYHGTTVHVLDASRVVDVVSGLVNEDRRAAFERENRDLQEKLRQQHTARQERPLLTYTAARDNALRIDWARETIATPSFLGRRVVTLPLDALVPLIDWTFFFAAWELKGRYPAILDHPQYGSAARDLFANAQRLLDRIIREQLLTAQAVYGFWPAASEGDDLVLFADETRRGEIAQFNLLRQQEAMASGQPNLSLADFVGPRDYVGAFAATAGIGADALVRRFEADHDDYNAILVKALADRLAEAAAAYLHQRARQEWGIDEPTTSDDVLAERHRGIRPAFGYPACPDHSEKFKLFELLRARDVGIDLTEHAAMTPAASVSGLYFASPHARYFTVGRLGEDQLADYAKRKGQSIEATERWLTPNLAYEPARC